MRTLLEWWWLGIVMLLCLPLPRAWAESASAQAQVIIIIPERHDLPRSNNDPAYAVPAVPGQSPLLPDFGTTLIREGNTFTLISN